MQNSFLQQTARSIIETIEWKQLSNTTLVLPSHRAGLVLKDELLRLQQESHTQAIWAPDVKTLPQLQDALSPLYAEDEFMTIVRLYRHYRRLNVGDNELLPLDLFYGWGRQMIADFTNIDASMPAEQVPNFFDNTIAAHELSLWQLDPEVEERLRALINPQTEETTTLSRESVRRQYEHVWRQLYELYRALHAEMEAEQKGYTGMRQRSVIERWDEDSIQNQISGRTYVFVGFNYLLPVERDLMQHLKEAGQACFYWDYIESFQANEKAFSFAALNSQLLGNALPAGRWTTPREVTVMRCASREAQAQFVHSWLQENYREKGDKVGVVICDETMLEPVIYTLSAITLPGQNAPEPINITKGFPLRNTQVFADVMHWLTDRARGDANTVVSPEWIDRMLAELFPTRDEAETTADQPEETNIGMRWQDLLVLESEYQTRKIAHQIRSLLVSDVEGVTFTLKLLRLLMRRAMESVTMPFHGEPVTDMQLMGVLETRLLDFDRLLLLNVEEGIIPQRKQDGSFIPFYLRKAYHMQTADERATVYAYNFFRLLSRAGHATLLYTSADTAAGGKGKSRFIMQIEASPEFAVTPAVLLEPSVLAATQELQTTPRTAPLKRLSPSGLNTYITCPRSFYWQYILNIRPQDEEDVLFAPNTMGSFVHRAMEFIYRHYFQCDNVHPVRVTPEAIEAIRTDETKLQEALLAAYEAMNNEWLTQHPDEPEHYVRAHHTSENVLIIGFVRNILERDREDARAGLQIYQLEKKTSFTLQLEGLPPIELNGTIDRLDIYGAPGNERLRVIDYKSGGYNDTTHAKKMSATWDELMENEDKGYVRQTLIYSHAVATHHTQDLPIEPHLYFCRHKLVGQETTVDVEGSPINSYNLIADLFLQRLQTKVQEVLTATDFPKCEENKCPTFCPFFDLCGRKPQTIQ